MLKQMPCVALLVATPVMLGLVGCGGSSSGPAALTATSGVVTAGGANLDEYVTLMFTPAGGGNPRTAQTDTAGSYSVSLPAGTYDATVTRPGYLEATRQGVVVNAGQQTQVDFTLIPLPANSYIGSVGCAVCHDDQYQTFRQTGHPFKLNKVNGEAPTYPFTSLAGVEARINDDDTNSSDPMAGTDNTLGTPTGWADISYVVGGFAWKARFLDANGYVVTGSEVQYNFSTDAMASYHDNEIDKSFSCGNCHTTGWQHFDSTINNARQDGLPGMDGTFAEQGIGCESCHGAGATHARTSLRADVIRVASPRQTSDFMDGTYAHGKAVDCSECHTRDGARDYPDFLSKFDKARMGWTVGGVPMPKPILPAGGRIETKGGLVRHHEQYDEALGIDPDTLESTRNPAFLIVHGNCLICHDPHKAAVHVNDPAVTMPGVDASNNNCYRCHAQLQYDPANNLRPIGSMKELDCVECHMPKTAKSATSRTLPNGVIEGDVTSHVFSIDIYGPQFTADGKFSYPDLGFDFSCRQCHGDEAFDIATPPANFNYHPDN